MNVILSHNLGLKGCWEEVHILFFHISHFVQNIEQHSHERCIASSNGIGHKNI